MVSAIFTSYGGGVHHSAYIGGCPESRDWKPGDPMSAPEIDATARIEAFVTVDAGLYGATKIGARTWLMKHVHVGHDAKIGADCELAPHCSVGGHVVLRDGVRVGQGALFRPFVNIGAGARVGMGAVVVCDIPPGETWIGNPARRLRAPRHSPSSVAPDCRQYGRMPDYEA